jgi:hypothetical protein
LATHHTVLWSFQRPAAGVDGSKDSGGCVDRVDVNYGCLKVIAKRGLCIAYLMEEKDCDWMGGGARGGNNHPLRTTEQQEDHDHDYNNTTTTMGIVGHNNQQPAYCEGHCLESI